MRYLKLLYLAMGVVLLLVVVAAFDFQRALALVGEVGGLGFAGLLAAYLLVFLLDTWLWQLSLPAVGATLGWFLRLARVRLVGEAYNDTLPAAGLGGEPVKALLLKGRYGVDMAESMVSIVLFRTLNLIGQVLFLALAFALMAMLANIPGDLRTAAGIGFGLLLCMTLALVGCLAWRLASRAADRIGQWRWSLDMRRGVAAVKAAELRIVGFHRRYPVRFLAALALSLAQWLAGALEIWLALWLVGHPVGLEEAVVIEALVQAVRTASFFIPANLGAQDGAVVLIVGAFTGAPVAGLSIAILRRLRQLAWIVAGFVVGGHYSWRSLREVDPSSVEKS